MSPCIALLHMIFRSDPERLYTVFAEVVLPTQNNEQPWVLRTFPHDFNNQQVLKMVSRQMLLFQIDYSSVKGQGQLTPVRSLWP